ncbi:hypothetical protein SAMN04489842_0497 [Natronobacterium texcoconense]|uniref:Uncharacterized protein n=1 Tax=Natronobacterium texcoconense TaxID=1095778 RepID=A0A1H0ZZE9_NATTX|nr:hypothetical protein SAMN04489842_0497 [Natronobacterium texcoconense]
MRLVLTESPDSSLSDQKKTNNYQKTIVTVSSMPPSSEHLFESACLFQLWEYSI